VLRGGFAFKNNQHRPKLAAAWLRVIENHDVTLLQLTQELKAFDDKAPEYDWAMVYYAGHGIEVGSVNYLIPVDAELATSTHVHD
jgi:uncharacterized caspase-like protein